ncbi:SDR family oxidoreductase [Moraxella sp. ZJ142]|uniref:SDR family oxidoreductase n=1 Tax=Moraxella marmotae TaxID=3344520 RepID=UPI0035D44CCF
MTTFAITAANGQLGRLVLEQLKKRVPADNIVALVRDPVKATDLGVAVRAGDYDKPDELEASLQGVDKLLLISGMMPGAAGANQHQNVINAAKKAGVTYIAYTSVVNADNSPFADLGPKHRGTEDALKASGLDYTILRHAWYSENYTESVPAALANNALYGSAKDGKISSATRADLAEADAIVLSSDEHHGKTYELAGDETYTLSDFAAVLSELAGKDITYVDMPQADYAAALQQAGLPDELAEALAYWDSCVAQDAVFSTDKTLAKLLGCPTTDLKTAIQAALQS